MALSGFFFRCDFGCAWALQGRLLCCQWLSMSGSRNKGVFQVFSWCWLDFMAAISPSVGKPPLCSHFRRIGNSSSTWKKKRVSFFIGTNCTELSTDFLAGLAFAQATLCSVCISKYLGVVLIPSSICLALLGGVGICWPEKQSDRKWDLPGQRAGVVHTVNTSLYLYLYAASWVMSVRRGKPASQRSEMCYTTFWCLSQLPCFIAPS